MGTGPNTQEYQAAGGNGGVSLTRCASPGTGSRQSGSSHNPHLVPPEAFRRMCQASGGGARKRLDSAHPAVLGTLPLGYTFSPGVSVVFGVWTG